MYRHIKRIEWIKENTSSLQSTIGFVPHKNKVRDFLVTNVHVPMKYIESLPISTNKIGTLKQLKLV